LAKSEPMSSPNSLEAEGLVCFSFGRVKMTGAELRSAMMQEDACVNNAIERAIAAQDAFLDELESRRWSISSTASTFTELSRSSEELECAVKVKDAS